LIERDPVIFMANCRHNVTESLKCRYLKNTPEIGTLDMDLVMSIISQLSNEMKKHYKPEYSFSKFVKAKTGVVRKRYLKAYKQLLKGTRNLKKISKIKAFVKEERYYEEGKAPRMIMGRDPRFNILYSRFTSRLEEAFFSLPQVANSCDFRSCGKKFAELLGDWLFENDMSKYESSQREFHLYLEFLVYANVVSKEEIDDLMVLFATKMKKRGEASGVKFEFDFCRGSGDMDTSLGNGILNYIATMYFMIVNFCPNYKTSGKCLFEKCQGCWYNKFVLKGDDNYGKCRKGEIKLINTFLDFGFDAKLKVNTSPKTTEFCSGNFVELADGSYYYVQKLKKLVQSLETCINGNYIKNGWLSHYYKSLGLMYKHLYGNLPVYGEIADFLLTSSKFGINTSLIGESYGASEAFKAAKSNSANMRVDYNAGTLVDIAMNNDMTFKELDELTKYFRTHTLNFPKEYSKRCNVRARKEDDVITVCDDVVYDFDRKLDKSYRAWYCTMRKLWYAGTDKRRNILRGVARKQG